MTHGSRHRTVMWRVVDPPMSPAPRRSPAHQNPVVPVLPLRLWYDDIALPEYRNATQSAGSPCDQTVLPLATERRSHCSSTAWRYAGGIDPSTSRWPEGRASAFLSIGAIIGGCVQYAR